MSIRETMIYPFREGWQTLKERFGRRESGRESSPLPVSVPAE